MPEDRAPLVSILIPTFNSERFLPETLDSAQAQTWEDVEIVVVDNCSTDSTRELVEAAKAGDRRIRLHVNESNIGPVGNFRRCLELARGEFVKYLMSDDLLVPDCVERLAVPMLEDDSIVLSSSRRTPIDPQGEPMGDTPSTEPLYECDTVADGIEYGDRALERNLNQIGEPSTVLFRAGLVDPQQAFTFHGERFRVLADVSLWLTLLESGRGSYIADPLSSFRRHPGQDQKQLKLLFPAHMEWVRLVRAARQRGYLATRRQRRRAVWAYKPRVPLYAAAAVRPGRR